MSFKLKANSKALEQGGLCITDAYTNM